MSKKRPALRKDRTPPKNVKLFPNLRSFLQAALDEKVSFQDISGILDALEQGFGLDERDKAFAANFEATLDSELKDVDENDLAYQRGYAIGDADGYERAQKQLREQLDTAFISGVNSRSDAPSSRDFPTSYDPSTTAFEGEATK